MNRLDDQALKIFAHRRDLPAAGVGIASQKPFFERISGPTSCAPTITGALDHTTAAALRLGVALGNCSDRMVRARHGPRPAPVICKRHARFADGSGWDWLGALVQQRKVFRVGE